MSDTLTDLDICPACLTELPAGYEYDHVAIDRAVAGDRNLFLTMRPAERAEVVVTALARGGALLDLSERLNWPYGQLQKLLPDDHPDAASPDADEQRVFELWQKGIPDVAISVSTGFGPSKVGRIRKRLGLDTLPRTRRRPADLAGQGFQLPGPGDRGWVS